MDKKVSLIGCVVHNKQGKKISLTESQLDVLTLLSYPNSLTQESISIKRRTSRQAVNKIVKKLKDKGLYSKTYNALEQDSKLVAFNDVSTQPSRAFRFHNMRWTIKILKKLDSHKGKEAFTFGGDKIKVWENVIEIYSKKHFFGETPSESYAIAMDYWYKVFVRLENRCNVVLLKDQYMNIQLTKCELANINNEIAKDYITNGKKFQVKGQDGKVWALIDNSFGLFEFETINATTVKPDMEKITKVLNDYRNHELLSPLEVHKGMSNLLKLHTDLVEFQNSNLIMMKALMKKVEELKK